MTISHTLDEHLSIQIKDQGSLYPALYRLEDQGLIRAGWGKAPTGRRAKIYRLTRKGEKRLAREESQWLAFSTAVNRVLAPEG